MKSYIKYKNQMEGFKDVSETVKTTEKIAASAVHFLKQKVSTLNAYTTEIEKTLTRLSVFYQRKDNILLQKRTTGERTLIILTSNKGLVGGLWHKIVNTILENTGKYQSFVVIGTKGENYLKEENMQIVKLFTDFSDTPKEEEIRRVTDYIFNEFKNGRFSQVDILYPKFVSLSEQASSFTQFLPFEFDSVKITNSDGKNTAEGDGLPIFEPSKQKLFNELLQKYIGVFFHKIIMETKLSELSARTVAMERAASKTDELIGKLTISYAKERRRRITQGQLESFAAHKTI